MILYLSALLDSVPLLLRRSQHSALGASSSHGAALLCPRRRVLIYGLDWDAVGAYRYEELNTRIRIREHIGSRISAVSVFLSDWLQAVSSVMSIHFLGGYLVNKVKAKRRSGTSGKDYNASTRI
jgi:hypothetical protein